MINQFNEYHDAAIKAAKHGNLDLLKPLVIKHDGATITIRTEYIYNQAENTAIWPCFQKLAIDFDPAPYMRADGTTTVEFVSDTTITVEGPDADQIAFARACMASPYGNLLRLNMSRDNGRGDPLKIKYLAAWQVQAILAQIS